MLEINMKPLSCLAFCFRKVSSVDVSTSANVAPCVLQKFCNILYVQVTYLDENHSSIGLKRRCNTLTI